MPERATLLEVSRLAGVSRSTASRALSGAPSVSPAARRRVEKAASALGYRTNSAARSLRTRRTMLVGLIMNNLVNATFHVVAEVLQRRLDDNGYRVLLCITGAEVSAEERYLRMLSEHHVDGVVIIGTGSNEREIKTLQQAGTAVVRLIRTSENASGDVVLASDEEGARQAIDHLIQLGHREIACIVGPPESTSAQERLAGYRGALANAGIETRNQLIIRGPYNPDVGAMAVERLMRLPHRPSALYIANHEAALGALPALTDQGVGIPSQLSVVCHEEAPWFRYWTPAITVIDNGAHELAEIAVSRLLARMKHPLDSEECQIFRVGARLVVRASTAAVPAPAKTVKSRPRPVMGRDGSQAVVPATRGKRYATAPTCGATPNAG